jgi:hypothetical protein
MCWDWILRRTESRRLEAAGWIQWPHPFKVIITEAGRQALAVPPVPEVPGVEHTALIRYANGGPLPGAIEPLVYDECLANEWITTGETRRGYVATPIGCAAIGEPLNLPLYAGMRPRAAAAALDIICGRIVIVPCGSAKLPGRAAAGDMYIGSYHQATRRAAAALGGQLLILSARYGLVTPDQLVDPYDLRIGDNGCVSVTTVKEQALRLDVAEPAEVIVLAGAAYADVASAVWPTARRPLDGTRGIGPQLQRLAAIAESGSLNASGEENPTTARRRSAAATDARPAVTSCTAGARARHFPASLRAGDVFAIGDSGHMTFVEGTVKSSRQPTIMRITVQETGTPIDVDAFNKIPVIQLISRGSVDPFFAAGRKGTAHLFIPLTANPRRCGECGDMNTPNHITEQQMQKEEDVTTKLRRRRGTTAGAHTMVTAPRPDSRSLVDVSCSCGTWTATAAVTVAMAATAYGEHTTALAKAPTKSTTAARGRRRSRPTKAELTRVENLFASLFGDATPAPAQEKPGGDSDEIDFERMLFRLQYTGRSRGLLGTVTASRVATGVFAAVTGILPGGEETTLVGYIVEALRVVKNYQGWTTDACMALTVAEHPHHLDGVALQVPFDAELDVLETTGGPAGPPAPWRRLTAEEVLADAGLELADDDGPGRVTGSRYRETDRKFLSSCNGPVRNEGELLKQHWVDKAIQDGVWPHPIETGPTPVRLVRQGAYGTITGLVDGVEQTVTGEFDQWWTRSHGRTRHRLANVRMEVPDDRPRTGDECKYRMVSVQVPATGAMFMLGGPPRAEQPQVSETETKVLAQAAARRPADAVTVDEQGRSLVLASQVAIGVFGRITGRLDSGKTITVDGYVLEVGRPRARNTEDPIWLRMQKHDEMGRSKGWINVPADARITVLDPPDDGPAAEPAPYLRMSEEEQILAARKVLGLNVEVFAGPHNELWRVEGCDEKISGEVAWWLMGGTYGTWKGRARPLFRSSALGAAIQRRTYQPHPIPIELVSDRTQSMPDPHSEKERLRLLRAGELINGAGNVVTEQNCWQCFVSRPHEIASGTVCPYEVGCKLCDATAGRPCVRPTDQEALDWVHAVRRDHARKVTVARAQAGDLTVPVPWLGERSFRQRLAAAIAQSDRPGPEPGSVLPIHQVPLHTYGTVKGRYSDGSRGTESGYLTEPPRVYTGGEGATNRPKYKGVEQVTVSLYDPNGYGGGSTTTMHLDLDATYLVLEMPLDRPLPEPDDDPLNILRGGSRSRRMPSRDVRAGDLVQQGEWGFEAAAGSITLDADPAYLEQDRVQLAVTVSGKPTMVDVDGYSWVTVAVPVPWNGPDAGPQAGTATAAVPVPESARQLRAQAPVRRRVALATGERPGRKELVHVVDWRVATRWVSLCGIATLPVDKPNGTAEQATCRKCKTMYRALLSADLPGASVQVSTGGPKKPAVNSPLRRRRSGISPGTTSAAEAASRLAEILANASGEDLAGRHRREEAERYDAGMPLVRHERQHSMAWTWVCPVPTCAVMRMGAITTRIARASWLAHCDEQAGANHPADFTGSWPEDIKTDDTVPGDAIEVMYGTVPVGVIYKVGRLWALECGFDHGPVPHAEVIGAQSDTRAYLIMHCRSMHAVPDPEIPTDEDLLPENPASDVDETGLYRRIRDEAQAVLEQATQETDRDLLAWAAGVMVMTYAGDVLRYIENGRRPCDMVSDWRGGTLNAARRSYNADRTKGFRITERAGEMPWEREVVINVPWARVAKLIDRAMEADELLLERIKQAGWRRARVLRQTMDYTPERTLADRTSHEVTAMLWDAARPVSRKRTRGPARTPASHQRKARTTKPAFDVDAFLAATHAAMSG